jgi:hypothetical protein
MTDNQTVVEGEFVQTIAGALSVDGQIGVVRIVRANGQIVDLPFPMEEAAGILLNIERVLGVLFEQQRVLLKGEDPRKFFRVGSKQVTKFQGAADRDGNPVLSVVLDTGVRLDFSLKGMSIPDLIAWLKTLDEAGQISPSVPH